MKKHLTLLLALALMLSLAACGNSNDTGASSPGAESVPAASQETPDGSMQTPEGNTVPTGEQAAITLTIGDTVLDAYLNGSAPAQSLLTQLPLTVTLNDSDNDFCGDYLDIEYAESDVQFGYQNGDLAFWPPASNFVIFVSGEENSGNTGDLVILGHITSGQEMLDALEGRIEVTIALSE